MQSTPLILLREDPDVGEGSDHPCPFVQFFCYLYCPPWVPGSGKTASTLRHLWKLVKGWAGPESLVQAPGGCLAPKTWTCALLPLKKPGSGCTFQSSHSSQCIVFFQEITNSTEVQIQSEVNSPQPTFPGSPGLLPSSHVKTHCLKLSYFHLWITFCVSGNFF